MDDDRARSLRLFDWLLILTIICGAAHVALLVLYFVRARTTSSVNSCLNNLRQLDGAKQQWALENNVTNGIPTWDDVKLYLGRDPESWEKIRCHSGPDPTDNQRLRAWRSEDCSLLQNQSGAPVAVMNAIPTPSFNWRVFVGLVLIATVLAVSLPNLVPPLKIEASVPCYSVLRHLNGAKIQWASEHHASTNDLPTWKDLSPYLSRSGSLEDMDRATAHFHLHPTNTYVLGDLKTQPRCRVNPRHALSAKR